MDLIADMNLLLELYISQGVYDKPIDVSDIYTSQFHSCLKFIRVDLKILYLDTHVLRKHIKFMNTPSSCSEIIHHYNSGIILLSAPYFLEFNPTLWSGFNITKWHKIRRVKLREDHKGDVEPYQVFQTCCMKIH